MNGPVFVAAVIERDDWKADISFVGHENTIQIAVSIFPNCRTLRLTDPGFQPTSFLPTWCPARQTERFVHGRFGCGRLFDIDLAEHTACPTGGPQRYLRPSAAGSLLVGPWSILGAPPDVSGRTTAITFTAAPRMVRSALSPLTPQSCPNWNPTRRRTTSWLS